MEPIVVRIWARPSLVSVDFQLIAARSRIGQRHRGRQGTQRGGQRRQPRVDSAWRRVVREDHYQVAGRFEWAEGLARSVRHADLVDLDQLAQGLGQSTTRPAVDAQSLLGLDGDPTTRVRDNADVIDRSTGLPSDCYDPVGSWWLIRCCGVEAYQSAGVCAGEWVVGEVGVEPGDVDGGGAEVVFEFDFLLAAVAGFAQAGAVGGLVHG
ncbi:MAG TPA: hypothetical protein VGX23_31995, partial [Actinocrinis sp.]|nr:hypothetical protein [Actinocrinis sp.]